MCVFHSIVSEKVFMACPETTEKMMDGGPNKIRMSLFGTCSSCRNIFHKDSSIQLAREIYPQIQIQCTGWLQFNFGMAILRDLKTQKIIY